MTGNHDSSKSEPKQTNNKTNKTIYYKQANQTELTLQC